MLWEAFVRRCSVKKAFLKISQHSQVNTCVSLFFDKVAGLRPANLLRKRLWHRCFPMNFVKFLRTSFVIEHIRVIPCETLQNNGKHWNKLEHWHEMGTAWKVSVFGVFMVRIFPHSDWIRTRKTLNTDTFHAVELNHVY